MTKKEFLRHIEKEKPDTGGHGFIVDGVEYNCGEQYMMHQKALHFNDNESANKILNTSSPKLQKQLGREVRNFSADKWDVVKYDIVKKGLKEKFNQNIKLKEYLLKYHNYVIVEASPYDRIWGIGYYDYDAINNINNWGENLLGKILTELSSELFVNN